MKQLFFIVDCSGSVGEDITRVSQINDLLRDVIELCDDSDVDISVITYADKAELYWSSAKSQIFLDMAGDRFGGRSNLGKAYDLVKATIGTKIPLQECIIVLISDGEATDNYRKRLTALDGNNQATRLAISIGTLHATTQRHASADKYAFVGGIRERDEFIDTIEELVEQ